ncbi:hypothetical protein SUDANB105_08133 (plasmid) [Streptomyces sp. enrichment culture]|uniref:hypothetical protein n=1 Tax=Streptomyces sp. enrichment culture TaxID=1795815 RepID=UPI003F56D97B
MKLLRRTLPPTQPAVSEDAVATGLRTLADDLAAGDDWARDCISNLHELNAKDLADYPTSIERRIRIAHLGKPGPGHVPDDAYTRLMSTFTSSGS